MQIRFPNIADYDVSQYSGFLPTELPLTQLPPMYRPWDDLVGHLSTSISSKVLRVEVEALPLLSASNLSTREELHRAFVVLGFLIHAYVWSDGSDHPKPDVPAQLAEPYLVVCTSLGMQPTLSYAGLCLWNWQIKPSVDVDGLTTAWAGSVRHLNKLEDLDCLASFTGTRDEAVFYLVPIMVEAQGCRLVNLLLEAMKEASSGNDTKSIIEVLEETKDTLRRMGSLIKLLHEQCNPKLFYNTIRPFYPGGKGMEDKGMPNGVVFHRVDGTKVNAKCVGGSAAQSSIFQFIDAALGIRHEPVGTAKGETLFQEMRLYMPKEHRDFLDLLSQLPSLRDLVERRPGDKKLEEIYNLCLQELSSWRSRHIGVVTTHIVNPSRDQGTIRARTDPEKVTEGLSVQNESTLKGTGGSALIPLLKQAKQETLKALR